MKRSVIGLFLLLILIVSACASSTSAVSNQACDEVIKENVFALKYQGQLVTYRGAYDGLYAYEVGGKTICATTIGSLVATEPRLIQDVIKTSGEASQETYPVFTVGLIGHSGILGFESYEDGRIIYLTIHNTDAVQLKGKPDSCILVDAEGMKVFNGQEITVIGYVTEEGRSWDGLYFQADGTTYCNETAYVQIWNSVIDIDGGMVLSEDYSWARNTSKLMNFKGIVSLDEAKWVQLGNDASTKQAIINIVSGTATMKYLGDPMVFEIFSRPIHTAYVDWNNHMRQYLLINTIKPDMVRPGYLYSPERYVDGGELKVGTVLGEIDGEPVTVTEIKCAREGMSFKPRLEVSYVYNSIETYTLVVPDTHLFFVRESGQGQVLTYYHAPALPECPTSF